MTKRMPTQKQCKRIFIVDDHPIFREGLSNLIRRQADLSVCGEADDAARALTAIEKAKPDLTLMEIGLPGRNGLELIKDLQAACPGAVVLVISMHDETLYAERVLRAGARGFIMKQEGPGKMLQAIRQVLEGQIYLSDKMAGRLLNAFCVGRTRTASTMQRLSDRELAILQLVGHGRDNHAIARQLHLSIKTVNAHHARIKEKLELRNNTELISYAARWVALQATPRT